MKNKVETLIKLKNVFGFSIAETMLGVDFIAGVGLIVTQMAKQSNEVQKLVLQEKTSYDVFAIA